MAISNWRQRISERSNEDNGGNGGETFPSRCSRSLVAPALRASGRIQSFERFFPLPPLLRFEIRVLL
jgi:hypothetical protein